MQSICWFTITAWIISKHYSLQFYLIPLILHVEYMLVYYYCLNSIQALYLTILFNSTGSICWFTITAWIVSKHYILPFYLIPLILLLEYMLVYFYCLNSIQAINLTILFNSSESICWFTITAWIVSKLYSLQFYLIPLILHVKYMLVYYYCMNSIQAL